MAMSPSRDIENKNDEIIKQIQTQNQEIHKLQQRNEKLLAENMQLKQKFSGKIGGEPRQDLEKNIQELTKQKMNLEESLRGEVLISEEQRNYIEILKEALEAKIEDLGLKEILEKEKGNICDVFAHFAAMKKEIDNKRKEAGLAEVKLFSIYD